MLKYRLALDIAPEYARPVDQIIAQIAAQSTASVQALNQQIDNPHLPGPAPSLAQSVAPVGGVNDATRAAVAGAAGGGQ